MATAGNDAARGVTDLLRAKHFQRLRFENRISSTHSG